MTTKPEGKKSDGNIDARLNAIRPFSGLSLIIEGRTRVWLFELQQERVLGLSAWLDFGLTSKLVVVV